MATSRSLGSITLDLILKLGGFTQGMQQAAQIAAQGGAQINKALASAGERLTAAMLTPLERYKAELKSIDALLKANAISQTTANRANKDAAATYQATSASGRAYTALLERSKTLTESLITPQERLNRELREYNALRQVRLQGRIPGAGIDETTFQRATAAAQARFSQAIDKPVKSVGLLSTGLQTLSRSLVGAASAYLSFYGAITGVRRIVEVIDEYSRLENRLSLVTQSSAELGRVQEELFQIAQRTRTEYAGVADLYAKLALTGNDLGVSQQNLLKFTEAVGNALAISGTSAQTARGALTQLSRRSCAVRTNSRSAWATCRSRSARRSRNFRMRSSRPCRRRTSGRSSIRSRNCRRSSRIPSSSRGCAISSR
jgi:hypothetical protein